MNNHAIQINDTILRNGEQAAGIAFNEKIAYPLRVAVGIAPVLSQYPFV